MGGGATTVVFVAVAVVVNVVRVVEVLVEVMVWDRVVVEGLMVPVMDVLVERLLDAGAERTCERRRLGLEKR
jgi:hypothetical protein